MSTHADAPPPPLLLPQTQGDAGPGRQPTAKASAAARRQAPYARPTRHSSHPRSFADCVIGLCGQLGKPLFGQSPRSASGDAFSVPWRVVDRETAELQEELRRAQREAAALEKKQLQGPAPEPAGSAAVDAGHIAPPVHAAPDHTEKVGGAPPYESVFDSVRKIAEHRAAKVGPPADETSKGKEAMRDDDSASDEEDDADFEPDASADDDEEEILQSEIEPIDEFEEITTPPTSGSASSNMAPVAARATGLSVSQIAELFEQRAASSPQADTHSTDMSVEEESSSDDAAESHVADDEAGRAELSVSGAEGEGDDDAELEVEVGDEAEAEGNAGVSFDNDDDAASAGEDGAEEEEDMSMGEDGDEDVDQQVEVDIVVEEESGSCTDAASDDSDQAATEELASIASDESAADEDELAEAGQESGRAIESDEEVSTQPLPESQTGPVADASQQTLQVPDTPSARKWWPFGGSSFLTGLRTTQSTDALGLAHPLFGVRRIAPVGMASDAGKWMHVPVHSELRTSALVAHQRRTTAGHTATPVLSASFSASPASPAEQPLASLRGPVVSSQPQSSVAETPLFTAASLGLEARRGAARGHVHRLRRRTSIYYGSGYGAHSAPYAFSSVTSTPATDARDSPAAMSREQGSLAVTQAASLAAHAAIAAHEVGASHTSSATAQKILDIIGEVPPARPQAILDAHEAINPYELSSPYSVRMRPKALQRRRVLVPLSARIAQAAGSAAAARPQAGASSAKAVLASIQSAAPAEVQARLGSTSKRDQLDMPTRAAQGTPPKSIAIAMHVSPSPAPPVIAQFATPFAAPTTPATSLTPTKLRPAPTPSASTQTTASKENQFAFTLPEPSLLAQRHCAIKAQVSALALADLPAFVLALDEQEPAPIATQPPSAEVLPRSRSSEWTCKTCELQSPAEADRCVVCDAARPPLAAPGRGNASAAPASTPNLLKAPALKSGEWTCQTCELQSPAEADECIVCDAARPGVAAKPPQIVDAPTPNLLKAPALKTGEWTCKTCELQSPADADRCVVCDAARPPLAAPGLGNAPAAPASTPNLLKAPALKSGEWTCQTCELQSPVEADKCIVCDAARPGVAAKPPQIVAAPTPNLLKAPALKSGEWTCQTCELQSPVEADKCIVCDAARPGVATKSPQDAAVTVEAPLFAFDLDVSKEPAAPAWWPHGPAKEAPAGDAGRPGSAKRKASQLAAAELPVFSFDLDVSKRPAVRLR
ncbi:hypothetical protein LPJ61_003222 [Coemansia biformis]|uniref:RanBP2-type domain-containing protein n=1 Tax=Coemansia biformis TaxID=1286918 RepID=A0A9W7YCK2_9FUNG|nr:hypothetical protein LPJ61_003222 [Coemansia biformis]